MTRFSISVPVGSWHPFLPACLESLRAQGDCVRVALLDASGDERVKEIGRRYDDWLAYRRHGPDLGQTDAILEGWANVDGDWLGWLNADDLLMPGALAKIVQAQASDPSLQVIYGHSLILDEDAAMTGYHFNVKPPSDALLQEGIISQPSCLFSRAACESVGSLNRDLHYVMDWDFWIRMYKAGVTFGFVEHTLSMVLWGGDTKTASLNKRRRQELRTLIAQHAPDAAQSGTFRAFAIHALADRMWPRPLQEAMVRRLRRGGPRVFGLRADGAIGDGCYLSLAHFDPEPKTGLRIELSRPGDGLKISADRPVQDIRSDRAHSDIIFKTPVSAGETCVIDLKSETPDAQLFRRAVWIT